MDALPTTRLLTFTSLGSYCNFQRVCNVAVPHQIESRGLLKLQEYVRHEDMLCIFIKAFDCGCLHYLNDNCSIEYNAGGGWSLRLRLGLTEFFQADVKITLDTQLYTTAI